MISLINRSINLQEPQEAVSARQSWQKVDQVEATKKQAQQNNLFALIR